MRGDHNNRMGCRRGVAMVFLGGGGGGRGVEQTGRGTESLGALGSGRLLTSGIWDFCWRGVSRILV
eukprot:767438-Hanusia_phi.AAC.11